VPNGGNYAAVIYIGNGDGTFAASSFNTGSQPILGVAIGDVRGVGIRDIVISFLNPSGLPTIMDIVNSGVSTPASSYSSNFGGTNPFYTASSSMGTVSMANNVVLANAGGVVPGTFSTGFPQAIAAVVTNNVAELMFVSFAGGTATGTLVSYGTATPTSIFVADLDGDGSPYLAIPQFGAGMLIYRNGSVTSTLTSTVGTINSVAGAYIHSTTRYQMDLLVGGTAGFEYFEGTTGNGVFSTTPQATYLTTDNITAVAPIRVTASNVTSTGADDVVVTDATNGVAHVFANNGSGTLTELAYSPITVGTSYLFTGDLTGSGVQDFVTLNSSTGAISVELGATPTITSILHYNNVPVPSPTPTTTLVVGATNPIITIQGPYFAPTASTVTITGTNGTNYTGTINTVTSTSTQLVVTVPTAAIAAIGTGSISVTVTDTASGLTTSATTATVLAAPTLTSITPSSGFAGQTNSITLTGTFPTGETPVVKWTPPGGSTTTITPTVVNTTTLTATLTSASSAGNGTVSVVDSGSGVVAATSQTFVITLQPTVSSLGAATTAVAGASLPVTLQVNGANFVNGSQITWCPGVGCTTPTLLTTNFVNSSQLTATLSSSSNAGLLVNGTNNPIPVAINVVGGSSASLTFYIDPSPTISATISPSSTTLGAAVTATISGTNFTYFVAPVIQWTPFGASSATQITPTVNTSANTLTFAVSSTLASSAGAATVKVVDSSPGFSFTFGGSAFTVVAPAVSSVVPSTTYTSSPSNGLQVTVTGTSFTPSTVVTICNACSGVPVAVSTTYVSATQLTANIPANKLVNSSNAPITAQVGVEVSSTLFGTSTASLTINPAIGFTASPSSAVTGAGGASGQTITLTAATGTVFPTTPLVYWTPSGGSLQQITPTSSTSTSLTFTATQTMLQNAATVNIQIFDNGGVTNYLSPAVSFTIFAQGSISSVTPNSAPAGSLGDIPLVITGTGFNATNSVVEFCFTSSCGSPTPLTTTFNSSTQLTAILSHTLLASATPSTTPNASIYVYTNGVQNGSPVQFTVTSGPTVSYPSTAPSASQGQTAVLVTINGSNIQPNSKVYWNCNTTNTGTSFALTNTGGSAYTFTITAPILATATSGSSPTAFCVYDTVTQLNSNSLSFAVNPPTITSYPTSLVSNNGVSGSVGFPVTITGSNFITAAQSGSSPQFSSTIVWTPTGGSPQSITPTSITATTLNATIPASLLASVGSATIGVINVNGTSPLTAYPISIVAGPVITSTKLANSTTNNQGVAGSTQQAMTINGTGFPTSTAPIVYWTVGTTATPLTVTTSGTNTFTATQITAAVPASLLATAGTASITVMDPSANSGVTSNPITFTIVAGPNLSLISPTSAVVNTQTVITLTGTNLPTASSATISVAFTYNSVSTVEHFTPTSISSTSLTFTIPRQDNALSSIQTDTIYVTDPQSGVQSNSQQFSVVSGPTISSVSPSTIVAGQTSSVTLVITGTNFLSTDTLSWTPPTVNGVTPAAITISPVPSGSTPAAGTSYISSFGSGGNSITAVIASSLLNTSGQVSVSVLDTPDGVQSSPSYIQLGGPTITNFSPAGTTAGITTATTLTVNGANFAQNTLVTWCPYVSPATTCSTTPVTLSTTYISSVQLTAIIPATLVSSLGSATIGVVSSSVSANATAPFTISNVSLTSSSVTSVSAGTPGIQTTLSGSNFTSTSTIVFTLSGTSTVLTPTYVNSSTLQLFIPALQLTVPGAATIAVQVGTGVSSTVSFTILGPVINTLSQTASPAGFTTSFPLLITGTNFVSGSTVYWNNGTSNVALNTSFQDAGDLYAVVTPTQLATAGTALVTVQNDATAISAAQTFSVGQAPTISTMSNGLTPSTLPAGSATQQVVITGTNYTTASTVSWNNSGVTTTLAVGFISATQLSVTVTAALLASQGSAVITVANGAVTSNPATFTISAGTIPVLTSITPATATAGGPAFNLVLQGSGFQTGSTVQWNNGSNTVSVATTYASGQLNAFIPASYLTTAGTVYVSVLNPGGGTSAVLPFTISSSLPTITGALNPNTAVAGSGSITLSVSGTNFVSGSTVNWNAGSSAVPIQTIFNNSTSLTAIVPASYINTVGTVLVTVVNPAVGTLAAGTSNTAVFTITPTGAPSINVSGGINPSSAVVGAAAFVATITGQNFFSGSTVQWTVGSVATQLTTSYISPTQLSVVIPTTLTAAATTAFITVTNPGGSVSNLVSFSVAQASAPTISTTNGLIPAAAAAGGAGFQLVVVGTGFNSTSVVYWNNGTNQALTTSYNGPQSLSAIVPASLIATSGVAFVTVQNPGTPALVSNFVPFSIGTSATIPTILVSGGLLPAQAAAGSSAFQMTVTGTNFVNGSIVQWNGGSTTTALTTGFSNSTTLTALVPATLVASPGIALVSILNPDKTVSNSVTFSVGGSVPVVTQLTPATAAAGTSGLLLVVNGTGFATGSTVMWGTTPLPTSFSSATQLTATVGTAQLTTAGSINVTVSSPGGTSNSVSFAVVGPIITLLSPGTVTVGAPAFTLTVGGDNFVSGAVVNFGGSALTTTFVSSNQLTAAVPASLTATAGSINVTVANPGGATSANFGFAVGALPNVTTIAPTSASPGSPGFTLTVTGTNFANGDTVQWNGVALVTTYSSATSLSAAVPSTLLTASGSVNVSVLHAGGVVSNSVQFTISSATVTSIAPTTAPAGSAAIQLIVTGTAFVNGSTVQWNGSNIPTTYVSATQLSATVSNTLLAAVGSAFVAVQNPGGSLTTGTIFTIAGPTLTSISPNTATSGSASLTLTLTGTNFVTNSVATWNGTALPTSVASATSASASVAANLLVTAGTYVVVMTNPGGAVTGSQFFTLSAPVAPTVSGLTPTSAIAGSSAFQITVAGSGFVSGSTVEWNGTAVPTNFVSAAQLTALIGANLIATSGTANITVQIPGAPISATTSFPINPPAITTLSPTTVAAGGPAFNLTVTGGNFIPGSSVQWNGTSLPTIYNSATSLTANVAASLIATGGTASVTVQNAVGAVSGPSTFTIGPFTLVITTVSLPDAIVGTEYSQVLNATGGSPPYTWTSTAGTLPAGVTLDPGSGTLSGIPTAAVTGSVSFTVTDSVSRTITKSIALRAVAPLTITTTTPLTSAPAGTAFSQILAATGGTTPYTWGLAGNLPPGLALNTSTGQISGTPTVPGSYNFTINISDSRSQTASVPFAQTITVSGLSIGGITTTSTSGQQLPINVTLANPYSVAISGTLTMVFTSAVGSTDPSIQFSTGGLTTNFTIPAGTTQAVFGSQQSVLVITGTVAGTIAISASVSSGGAIVTPATAPSVTTTIAKAPPVITSVTLTASGSSLVVAVSGYSNTRDMTSGIFQFLAAPGSTLNAAAITENLAATFSAWYQSSASANFGSQFTISIPFTFTGSISAVGSVSVQLVNSAGTSAAVTAVRQ
jgi:hypothetical protein